MLQFKRILVISVIFSSVLCGRIDSHVGDQVTTTTEHEKPHIEVIMEKMSPSVSEDKIKVLDTKNGTVYDEKAKGKPDLFRKLVDKLHSVKATLFDETQTTTELSPESTSHSHVYERTAHTKTTVHKTKKDKVTSTTEMSSTSTQHSRKKRSFSKDELESFSEMGKVFSESFKKFNDDASKAQKDFMSFMDKLDKMTASHDH